MAKRNSKPVEEPAQVDAPASDESLPADGVPLLAGEAFLVSAPGTQVLADPGDDLQTAPAPPEAAAPPETEAPIVDPVRIVKLDLPLLQTPASLYAPRTLRELDRRHARALRSLTDGLAHEGAKIDGKPVRTPDQALAWLLDQLV